jgi:hypothetical protein
MLRTGPRSCARAPAFAPSLSDIDMIVAWIPSVLHGACTLAAPALIVVEARSEQSELEAKIAAAGRDVAKLLELAAACASDDDAKRVYKRVLELDPDNEAARKALRHQRYDGKWFESFAELSKYKREEAARMKAKGLARFKEEWVPEADLPFLNMGWVRDEGGQWAHPAELERRKQVEAWKAAGYQFRADDNSWVAPNEMERWAALLWKCGDEWVDLAKANEHHARIEQPWELTGEHFEVWSTCEWELAHLARWHADQVQAELVRVFGTAPREKPHVFLLSSLDQYNQAASTGTIGEIEGFSSLHGAYFADAFFDGSKPPRFLGCGVSYWDRKDPKVAVWGPYWLRWAAAQSFVEALDPSWSVVSERIAGGLGGDPAGFAAGFWGEKRIPRWLRYGAAAYAERFLRDPEAAAGADPWALRAFAISELKKAGGLRKLDEVFAFGLSLNDLAASARLYNEAGLLVSFLLDGAPGDAELAERLKAFQTALASGAKPDVTAAASALQKALAKREREIRKYAGL